MSKHINVNPDHYKVAGRERQGEGIVHDDERGTFEGARAHAQPAGAKQPHIPNQERASTPTAQDADASEAVSDDDTSQPISNDEGMID
jgi:hypothetical protein